MEVERHSFIANCVLGTASAALAASIRNPLEKAKLNLAVTGTATPKGYLALWQGNLRSSLRSYTGITFAIFGTMKKHFNPENIATTALVGGLAGASQLIFVFPLHHAEKELAVSKGTGNRYSFYQAFLALYQREGLAGVYRGYGITAAGIFVYRGIYFGLYDTILKHSELTRKHLFLSFPAAWFTAYCANIVAHPIDYLRMRYAYKSKDLGNMSIWAFGKEILHKEGHHGFWRGSSLRSLNRSLTGAITLSAYTKLSSLKWFSKE